jgi:hypothetical protein
MGAQIMSHPFGDLVTQHLSRKHGLSQNLLASDIDQDESVISRMCKGERLTGAHARERVLNIITWFKDQEVLSKRSEADALLAAAGMSGLRIDAEHATERALAQSLPADAPTSTADLEQLSSIFIIRDRRYNLAEVPPSAQHIPFMVPPLPPQGIFGRDAAMKDIFDLLALQDDQARDVQPIALRGLGGIGKTTLAVAIGRLALASNIFPDGVLWVALGLSPTVRILLDSWGKHLGLDLYAERDENASRDRLRTALFRRRTLLLIDDVWNADHAQYFNVGGPHCRTLFTTRELPIAQLLATRQRTLRVDVLEPDAAFALLQRLAPDVVTTNERGARRLCERLEFLPLALTLAGRLLANEADVPQRMQRLLDELIERRDARLRLLQAEKRDGLEDEQPSLQAILGMSIERLAPIDQERFAMLSTFGGDPLTWEINAATYVWDCSPEEAEITVSHFVHRGLVEPRGARYWMHALLADYAGEMLEGMNL